MHRKLPLKNDGLYRQVRQMSNITKFKILELTQADGISIKKLAKETNTAFNKCSNYCTQLEKHDLVFKNKVGKNVLVKSKLQLNSLLTKTDELYKPCAHENKKAFAVAERKGKYKKRAL
jgi:predicted transcriptional regulator